MGHVNEVVDEISYPIADPARFRNRVVGELNFAYFWEMVGPDIEAAVPWETRPTEMKHFARWLRRYDKWLGFANDLHRPELRARLGRAVRRSLAADEIFAKISLPDRMALEKSADDLMFGVARTTAASGPAARLELARTLLRAVFTAAYEGATRDERTFLEIKSHSRQWPAAGLTLEFRRIPAQANADEAAMWMNLLEGRWRANASTPGLVPLARPRRPETLREKVGLFVGNVEAAGMHPLDFAKFLSPSRRRLVPRRSVHPRWRVRREALLCEANLATTPAPRLRTGR